MKATFYERNHSIRVDQHEIPEPAPDEVQLAVEYCGICGTDLGIYHGKMDWRVAESQIMGHEMSGIIAATGRNVRDWQPGERVTVRPLDPCHHCPNCENGLSHICENLKFLGIDTPGAFQQRWNVPAHTLHRLPDTLSLEHAALIEPIAVACHDVRLGEVQSGSHVAVIGGGPIGALIALVAKEKGAQVLVSEINPFRCERLNRMGIRTCNPQDTDVAALIKNETAGRGADVVFEVTGHPSGIELATRLPKARGLIVVVGIFGQKPEVDLFQFFWKELRLCGARVYEPQDFEEAIFLAASGRLPLDALITSRYPLDLLQQGLEEMGRGTDSMKILIHCNS